MKSRKNEKVWEYWGAKMNLEKTWFFSATSKMILGLKIFSYFLDLAWCSLELLSESKDIAEVIQQGLLKGREGLPKV